MGAGPVHGWPAFLGVLRAFAVEAPAASPAEKSTDASSLAAARNPALDLVSTLESMGRLLSFQAPVPKPEDGSKVDEAQVSSPVETTKPSAFSHVFQTMSWHEQFMDETPEGRAMRDSWKRQVVLETRAVEAAAARYRRDLASAIQRGEGANMPVARRLLLRWFPPLVEAIREEQRLCYLRESQVDRSVYGPLLLLLEPEQLAVITMHCSLNAVMELADASAPNGFPGQTRVTRLALNIGRMIENQVNLEKLQALCRRQNRQNREILALQAEVGVCIPMLVVSSCTMLCYINLELSEWMHRTNASGELLIMAVCIRR